ncbi:class A beta-lactamase-related serine hydrolase [Polaromonas sp. P1(28)-13]|nr:class A beta-lactamase-related serine hydrolase [Polaromonas sp. P1(28)-13]
MPLTCPSRRLTLKLAASSLAAPALLPVARMPAPLAPPASVNQAIARFAALAPATSHCLVQVDAPTTPWTAAYKPDQQLFVGSAVKTFILAQFLRDAEAGREGLSESQLCEVSDALRSPGSPVLLALSGKTPYRSVLETMITHSDNTATDIALTRVGPERVRALIAEAGLVQTRIPSSTRKLFSYLAGADYGVDLGWDAMDRMARGDTLGLTPRTQVINAQESMLSSATEMVNWYRQSLSGKFFRLPATLNEYKRIHAMADAISRTVPPGILAFGKGGSIDWEGFHCLCFSGQMLVGQVPVTFCFTLNWTGEVSSEARAESFVSAMADVLRKVVSAIRA